MKFIFALFIAFALLTPTAVAAAPQATVSADSFGVTGNGKTDDTVALQKALGALKKNQTLHLTAGTYLIQNLSLPTGSTIVGDPGTILKACSDGGALLTLSGDNIRLSGLVIDGANRRTAGMFLKQAGNVSLDRCEIRNMSGTAKATARGMIIKGGRGISIRNSYFHDIRSESVGHVRALVGLNVESLTIAGCTFKGIGSIDSGDCVQISGRKDWICDLTIRDCQFSGFNRQAIRLQTAGGKILNNRISASPIAASQPTAQAAIVINGSNNSVEGNAITLHHSRHGIGVEGSHCSIRNNTILVAQNGVKKDTAGIRVAAGGSYSTLSHNTMRNIPKPIEISPGAVGVTASDNTPQ